MKGFAEELLGELFDLYQQQELCDVTFKVRKDGAIDGELVELRAHKVVVAAASRPLRSMLTIGMTERDKAEHTLEEVSAWAFKELLTFMYTGKATLSPDGVLELAAAADRFDVSGLRTLCCDYASKTLNPDNCATLLQAATSLSLHELQKQCLGYAQRHFSEMLASESFLDLDKETLKFLLSSDHLSANEEVVFRGVLRWVRDSRKNQNGYEAELLPLIRFPLLPVSLLMEIQHEPLLKHCSELQPLIMEALAYQAAGPQERERLRLVGPRTVRRKAVCDYTKLKCSNTMTGHTSGMWALVIVNDKLVSGSKDCTIRVWNTTSWTCERTLSAHNDKVWGLYAFQNMLVSGSADRTIKIWDPETWTCKQTLFGHSRAVVAFTSYGDKLISGSADRSIKVWNSTTWECERNLVEHLAVWALTMCGDRLVSGSHDNFIKVWNTTTWKCEGTLVDHKDRVWAVTTVGEKLASASADGTIKIWNTRSWDCEVTLTGHKKPVFAISANADVLISGSFDRTIKIWNTSTWVCERTITDHSGPVWALLLHGHRLISGSTDFTMKVFQ